MSCGPRWRRWLKGTGREHDRRAAQSLCCVPPPTFRGIFHCCVSPYAFQLGRAPSSVPFTHACPSPRTHPALLEALTVKASQTSLRLLLSWAFGPSGWYWFRFLQDIAMESFHFSFWNCCLPDCRECNTVYNIIYCNWLCNLRIKITLHCAKIKCFHRLLVIFPSRIIHEEYINVWFLIPIGTIFQNL